jgi:proline iminopeptidase
MKKTILLLLVLMVISGQIFAETHRIRTSDGEILHVTVKGTGIPCLYIHGGPGSGSWWLEKFMGGELEQQFTMIYLDQRGVARSTGTEHSDYSMERLVKDFEEVRKYLGIEKWLTMGHSFGGLLQMGYALRHPGANKGMLMINAALDMKECFEKSWCPKAMEFAGLTDLSLCTDQDQHFIDRWMQVIQIVQEKNIFWKMGYADENNFQIMNASFGDIPDWNWKMGNLAMHVADYHVNFKPYTAKVKVPVLFFYGKTDWMIGPKHYNGVSFPNMLLWESNVGHMPFMENQEDLLTAIIAYKEKFNF